jgi:hypothetical protein
VGSRAGPGMVVKRKKSCSLQKSNPRHPTHSSVTILTELPHNGLFFEKFLICTSFWSHLDIGGKKICELCYEVW